MQVYWVKLYYIEKLVSWRIYLKTKINEKVTFIVIEAEIKKFYRKKTPEIAIFIYFSESEKYMCTFRSDLYTWSRLL